MHPPPRVSPDVFTDTHQATPPPPPPLGGDTTKKAPWAPGKDAAGGLGNRRFKPLLPPDLSFRVVLVGFEGTAAPALGKRLNREPPAMAQPGRRLPAPAAELPERTGSSHTGDTGKKRKISAGTWGVSFPWPRIQPASARAGFACFIPEIYPTSCAAEVIFPRGCEILPGGSFDHAGQRLLKTPLVAAVGELREWSDAAALPPREEGEVPGAGSIPRDAAVGRQSNHPLSF